MIQLYFRHEGTRKNTERARFRCSRRAPASPRCSSATDSEPIRSPPPPRSLFAVSQALAVRKDQVKTTQLEIAEAEASQRHPFPTELSLWTVDDVCRWLDTLQLGEYKQAFREGKVGIVGWVNT